MQSKVHRLICFLSTVLLMVAVSGCVEPVIPEEPVTAQSLQLTFQLALPGSGALLTKAGEDDNKIVGLPAESKLWDLQIWAFPHQEANATASDEAVFYLHKDKTELAGVELKATVPYETSFPMSDDVLDGSLNLDFYVLANGPSVGVTETVAKAKKRSELKELTFGKTTIETTTTDYFGNTTKKTSVADDPGLPMAFFAGSGFSIDFLRYGFTEDQLAYIKSHNGEALPGSNPTDQGNLVFSTAQWDKKALFSADGKYDYAKVCPKIELTRAVSKIRFVFSKAESMAGTETVISRIALIDSVATTTAAPTQATSMLPVGTYLFPRESSTDKNVKPSEVGYEAFNWTKGTTQSPAPLFASSEIKTVDSPLRLRNSGDKTPQAYTTFLDEEIEAGHATEQLLYLRESDKENIYARIDFVIGSGATAVSGKVDIPLPSGNDFRRNRWWTVYAYFMSYELGFQVTVLPWDGMDSSDGQLEPEEL